jgi:hypothetical protein
MDELKSGSAGEMMKDCQEESGGFGGDGKGLPLAISDEDSGGAAEDNAAVVYDGKSGESGG